MWGVPPRQPVPEPLLAGGLQDHLAERLGDIEPAAFAVVKGLQEKNLIVPVVGDFAGPKAIRAVGDYVRAQRATVSAFYVSEVEPLLVTHNVEEAIGLADRLLLLSLGPARVLGDVPVTRPRTPRTPQELAAMREEIAERINQAYL